METGLDYFGARYMSAAQGRFTSPDPLYIELRRLGDPQQLNLYSYTRNNPLKFVDPTGLDITVTGDYGDDYLKYLQRNVSFKVKLDNGKVAIDQGGDMKKLRKSLKGGDRALFDAIADTKNHVTIATSGQDPNIDFGRFDGGGKNSIDFADLKLLEGPKNAGGPFTPERVVGHETLEAYAASKGSAIGDAHNYANGFFGGLEGPIPSSMQLFGNAAAGTVSRVAFDSPLYGNPGQSVRMTREFLTPIPMNSIPRGHIPANIVSVEKKP